MHEPPGLRARGSGRRRRPRVGPLLIQVHRPRVRISSAGSRRVGGLADRAHDRALPVDRGAGSAWSPTASAGRWSTRRGRDRRVCDLGTRRCGSRSRSRSRRSDRCSASARFFGVDESETLEALLDRVGGATKREVTDQARLPGPAGGRGPGPGTRPGRRDTGRANFCDDVSHETELYEAALTVMMRLVFLFFAEETRPAPARR